MVYGSDDPHRDCVDRKRGPTQCAGWPGRRDLCEVPCARCTSVALATIGLCGGAPIRAPGKPSWSVGSQTEHCRGAPRSRRGFARPRYCSVLTRKVHRENATDSGHVLHPEGTPEASTLLFAMERPSPRPFLLLPACVNGLNIIPYRSYGKSSAVVFDIDQTRSPSTYALNVTSVCRWGELERVLKQVHQCSQQKLPGFPVTPMSGSTSALQAHSRWRAHKAKRHREASATSVARENAPVCTGVPTARRTSVSAWLNSVG